MKSQCQFFFSIITSAIFALNCLCGFSSPNDADQNAKIKQARMKLIGTWKSGKDKGSFQVPKGLVITDSKFRREWTFCMLQCGNCSFHPDAPIICQDYSVMYFWEMHNDSIDLIDSTNTLDRTSIPFILNATFDTLCIFGAAYTK